MIAFSRNFHYNKSGDIMRQKTNICKFVIGENSNKIFTTNFVFEKLAENKDTMEIQETNKVYLVTEGKGQLCTETFKKEIKAGNVFFTFAQVPFNIKNTDNINYMYISFGGGRCEDLFARFGITPNNCIFEGHEGLNSFWQNSIVKAGDKNLDLISESVLLYTFAQMTPAESSDEQYLIGSILKYIEDNFTDSQLNLAATAEALGYNSKYISRIFKENMGISFSSYLTNVRIQHAVFLIEQGVTAIKNVALLSGYKDPFYFSSVFKSSIGMSPSEYISRLKK